MTTRHIKLIYFYYTKRIFKNKFTNSTAQYKIHTKFSPQLKKDKNAASRCFQRATTRDHPVPVFRREPRFFSIWKMAGVQNRAIVRRGDE